MGDPNSKRARRRQQARNDAHPDLVWWAGRWMERTYTSERIELGNGFVIEQSNETWHEPLYDKVTRE